MMKSRVAGWTAWIFTFALLAAYLLLLLIHGTDRFGPGTTSSAAWLGLTGQASVMPPAVYDGDTFAGTRYLPLALQLMKTAGLLVGDPILGGRLLSGVAVAGCLVLLATLLKREGAPPALIILCGALLLGSPAGTQALFGIHMDILPAALQLAAVTVIMGGDSRRRYVLAGVLCGVAVALKLTSVWGISAVILWGLFRAREGHRRSLAAAAAFVLSAAVLWIPFDLLTHGRALDNLLATAVAGEDPLWRLDTAWSRYKFLVIRGNRTTAPLLFAALSCAVLSVARRRSSPLQLALVLFIVSIFPTFADRGLTANHLIDQMLLAAAVVGTALARVESRPVLRGAQQGVIAMLVIALGLGVLRQWRPPVEELAPGNAQAGVGGRYGDPLKGILPAGALFLTEDAAVSSLRGERAVIADPFAFRRISAARPEWTAEVVARLDARDFQAVVLTAGASDRPEVYDLFFFGRPVFKAVLRNYRRADAPTGSDYDVYLPRAR